MCQLALTSSTVMNQEFRRRTNRTCTTISIFNFLVAINCINLLRSTWSQGQSELHFGKARSMRQENFSCLPVREPTLLDEARVWESLEAGAKETYSCMEVRWTASLTGWDEPASDSAMTCGLLQQNIGSSGSSFKAAETWMMSSITSRRRGSPSLLTPEKDARRLTVLP